MIPRGILTAEEESRIRDGLMPGLVAAARAIGRAPEAFDLSAEDDGLWLVDRTANNTLATKLATAGELANGTYKVHFRARLDAALHESAS